MVAGRVQLQTGLLETGFFRGPTNGRVRCGAAQTDRGVASDTLPVFDCAHRLRRRPGATTRLTFDSWGRSCLPRVRLRSGPTPPFVARGILGGQELPRPALGIRGPRLTADKQPVRVSHGCRGLGESPTAAATCSRIRGFRGPLPAIGGWMRRHASPVHSRSPAGKGIGCRQNARVRVAAKEA